MDPETLNAIRCAEEAVQRLVEKCQKQGTLYAQCPKTVAQVSRTGKWLLNAFRQLNQVLDDVSSKGQQAG